MKKIFVLLIAISLSFATTDAEVCKTIANDAKMIMSARQNGAPITVIYDVIEKQEDKNIKELFFNIMNDAYSTPKFITPEVKRNTINEFYNKWFYRCINNE